MSKENRKRILVICPYPEDVAAAQRLKYEQYFSYFREHGYEIDVAPFITPEFWEIIYEKGHFFKKVYWTIYGYLKRCQLLFTIGKYDLVYNFLWVSPFGKPVFEYLVASLSKKLVYDIDDMVFLGHSSEANRKLQAIKGRSKMIFMMKKADHVITCTPVLDEIARRHNDSTTDISSTIDTDEYVPKQDNSVSEPLCIGWSGSHSTSQYVRLLEPVFQRLSEEGLNYKVLVIGDVNFSFNDDSIPLEKLPWVREHEVRDLKKIDIGVYPLPDEPWVYGKSGLKALQYMALGIPTIASDLGTIVRIIKHKENGFLAKSTEDWVTAIKEIIADRNLQAEMGKKAIDTVESRFSIHSNAPIYLNILDKVTEQ
jgi:glycosyltransferase involved in cell wall biosynthesis